MHYYKHHIGDYLAGTTHLTLLEHGVYLRLIMLYYQTERALDANALRLICARSADEVLAAEIVLNEFFTKTDIGWIHGRCDAEILEFHGKSTKAKASAQARWDKKDADAMRTHSEGNANHKPLTTNQEPVIQNLLSSDDDAGSAKGKKETSKLTEADCQLIADKYNEVLSDTLPRAQVLTKARASAINARFKELLNSKTPDDKVRFTDKQSGIEWFGRFFGKVRYNPHWMGDNDRSWTADLDWVLKPANFAKILEYLPPKVNK